MALIPVIMVTIKTVGKLAKRLKGITIIKEGSNAKFKFNVSGFEFSFIQL